MIAARFALCLTLMLLLGVTASGFAQTEPTPSATMPAGNTDSTVSPATPGTESAPKDAAPSAKRPTFSLTAETEALQLTDDIETAKAQLKKHPNDPEAHFLMAAAYSRSPYLEQAFKHIKTVKRLLKETKDFEFIDRTVVEYETLLKSNPSNSVVLYRLAMGYYFKGYSIEKYPHHFKYGPTGTAAEYYKKAHDTINRVIQLNPKDTWARNYLGYLVSENGKDLTKAIAIWEESLAVDSKTNPGAYLLLSQAYLQRGDLQNALIYGAKGLEIKQAMGMTLP